MPTFNKPTEIGTTGQSTRTLLVLRPEDGGVEAEIAGWRDRSGGEASAEISTVQGDEYQGQFTIGGNNVSYDDLTATTFFDQVDLVENVKFLRSRLGYSLQFIEHPTLNGKPVPGDPIIYIGKLKKVKMADSGDRKSTDAMTVEITMEVSEVR